MIPDLYWAEINLGVLTVQVWGLFVALGIGVGLMYAKQIAIKRGLNGELVMDSGFWIISGALLGSRVWFVVTEWHLYINDLGGIFRVWDGGLSLNGGLFGALLVAYVFFKKRKVSFWKYADAMVFALPLGLAIGRLGCFFIFDHPGTITTFVLGEQYYADGLIHHNHGLYLSLNGLAMMIFFLLVERWRVSRQAKTGQQDKPFTPVYVMLFLLWYGNARVLLDADRILDNAFYGLTAAQWSGLVMILLSGIVFLFRKQISKSTNNT